MDGNYFLGPLNVLIFSVVPLPHRPLVSNAGNVVWTTYLSYRANQHIVHDEQPRVRTRRDEAAEELERALNESLQPDFLAQMVDAEWRLRHLAVTFPSPPEIQAVNDLFPAEDATCLDDDEDADDASAVEESI
ncbi:hypothetical protein H257_17125, partial [Aphanomyces astaci]